MSGAFSVCQGQSRQRRCEASFTYTVDSCIIQVTIQCIFLAIYVTKKLDHNNIYDGIIDWSDANLNTNSIYKIPNFGYGTDYWIMKDFSTGGVCHPVAATNILWYWGNKCGRTSVMNNPRIPSSANTLWAKAQAMYNLLHQGMGTVDSLGTFDYKILDGYANFFGVSASSTGIWNYRTISKEASYSEYQTALNGQCPIHLVLHTKAGTVLRGDGHGVYCFGYASSNTGVRYLFVMDGWNRGGRFVKFNYYPQVFGYKIYVR